MKLKLIDNGFEIIEGTLPEGIYRCYGGYLNPENTQGVIAEIHLNENQRYEMKIIDANEPEQQGVSSSPPHYVRCEQNTLTFTDPPQSPTTGNPDYSRN